jgi:excisionase family DNA binding protein
MSLERKEIPASPDYETKSQVARRLNVSKRTIDNLMKQRRLPFIKLTSKIVRFPKAEVDAFLARNFRVRAYGRQMGEND